MARPIHFEIPVDDPQRAIAFYSAALGWKAQKFDGMEYWLMATGEQGEPGIDGGIAPLLVGAFFAFLVALMPGEGGEHYYWEIMLPGTVLGLIVGYATQRYGRAPRPRPA